MNNIPAIPTMYNGLQFRSRLEATWACMLDKLGWDWDYEPIDLNGYIPDFILKFSMPLLVEVKPDLEFYSLRNHIDKIEQSGWKGDYLIVGSTPFEAQNEMGSATIGMLVYRFFDNQEQKETPWVSEGIFHVCGACGKHSFHHHEGPWNCIVCAAHDGDHYLGDFPYGEVIRLWRAAKNDTQWNPNTTKRASDNSVPF